MSPAVQMSQRTKATLKDKFRALHYKASGITAVAQKKDEQKDQDSRTESPKEDLHLADPRDTARQKLSH